jgi:thioredoxin 1
MANVFSEANFQKEVLDSGIPVLVDFWATWCGPCRMIAPIIDQLAVELAGKVKVGKVDVDANNGLASAYGVRTIPTLLLIKNGQVVDTMVGAASKDAILQRISAAL